MEMKLSDNSKRRLSGQWIAIVFCMLSEGCSKEPLPPVAATPNPFVHTVMISSIIGKETAKIGDPVSVMVNTGQLLQIQLIPQASPPATYLERKVSSDSEWALRLVIYPVGGSSSRKDTLFSGVVPMPVNAKKQPFARTFGFANGQWSDCGFINIPPLQRPVGKDAIAAWKRQEGTWFWTYLCASKDAVGDFWFELQVLPTARQISLARFELGDPLVVYRGRLHVTQE